MTDSTLPRVFVIGDSISIQYGPYLEKLCAGVFHYARKEDDSGAPRADANLDVPTGANGGDSAMVLAYLNHRCASDPVEADILLLNCGLHDIKRSSPDTICQVPIERYRENLRGIFEAARAMNTRAVWVRTTPVIDEIHNEKMDLFKRHARDVDAYNAVADELTREAGLASIDLHGFSLNYLPEGFCDHVHYTEQVRELQAGFVFENLRRIVF